MLFPIISWDAVQGIAAALTVIGGAGGVTATKILPWARTRRASNAIKQHVRDQDFLPSVIEGSLRYFVEPTCTNTDPAGREDYRAVAPMSLPLFQVLDRLLYKSTQPQYIILLADSGIGKTTALLNYFARNLRKRNAHPIRLIYLGTEGAQERIAEAPDKDNTILFLDALDEDKNAVTDHAARVRMLLQAAGRFRSVVMTCRSQFFPSDEEITRETGLMRVGPTPAGDTGECVFQKLYIEPFSDTQVQEYLRRRYPLAKWSARRQAKRVLDAIGDLSARPMLLAYVDDLLRGGKQITSVSEAYRQILEAWFAREKRHVGDIDALRRFSEALSVEVFVGSHRRKGEFVTAGEIGELARRWNIPLETWKLTGRSLLNRNATGEYKFAHRSIMEYLFATQLFRCDPTTWSVPWTDQIQMFAVELFSKDELHFKDNVYNLKNSSRDSRDEIIMNTAKLIRRLSRTAGFDVGELTAENPGVILLPLVRAILYTLNIRQPRVLLLVEMRKSREIAKPALIHANFTGPTSNWHVASVLHDNEFSLERLPSGSHEAFSEALPIQLVPQRAGRMRHEDGIFWFMGSRQFYKILTHLDHSAADIISLLAGYSSLPFESNGPMGEYPLINAMKHRLRKYEQDGDTGNAQPQDPE